MLTFGAEVFFFANYSEHWIAEIKFPFRFIISRLSYSLSHLLENQFHSLSPFTHNFSSCLSSSPKYLRCSSLTAKGGKCCQRSGGKWAKNYDYWWTLLARIDYYSNAACIFEEEKKEGRLNGSLINFKALLLLSLSFFLSCCCVFRVCVDRHDTYFTIRSSAHRTKSTVPFQCGDSCTIIAVRWKTVGSSLCTWHNPTENCPSSGICRRISSVTRWTPRCWGLKLILRWNQAEPICIPLLAPRWLEFDAIAVELNYRRKLK